MDPYYRVKSDIHKQRPIYGYLLAIWMLFMGVLAGIFGYYLYNVETTNQCSVEGDSKVPTSMFSTEETH